MIRTIRIFLLLPLLVAAVIGCGASKKPTVVSGKISYNGAPVTGGTVAFFRTGEKQEGSVAADIQKDGSYTAPGVPLGEMIVTVDTEALNPEKHGAPKVYGQTRGKNAAQNQRKQGDYAEKMKERGVAAASQSEDNAGRYVKIPSKYSDKKTTTLKTTVKSGNNTYDVPLTD